MKANDVMVSNLEAEAQKRSTRRSWLLSCATLVGIPSR